MIRKFVCASGVIMLAVRPVRAEPPSWKPPLSNISSRVNERFSPNVVRVMTKANGLQGRFLIGALNERKLDELAYSVAHDRYHPSGYDGTAYVTRPLLYDSAGGRLDEQAIGTETVISHRSAHDAWARDPHGTWGRDRWQVRWGIIDLSSHSGRAGSPGKVIGEVTLSATNFATTGEVEVGLSVVSAYQERKVGTATVLALQRYCFEDLGARSVIAKVGLENSASMALFGGRDGEGRLGFEKKGEPKSELHRGVRELVQTFTISRDRWERPVDLETDSKQASRAVVALALPRGAPVRLYPLLWHKSRGDASKVGGGSGARSL